MLRGFFCLGNSEVWSSGGEKEAEGQGQGVDGQVGKPKDLKEASLEDGGRQD